MAIRGVDANLTVGKVSEQSPQAAQNARYHDVLLDRLAARAQMQEARDAARPLSASAAEQRGVDLNAEGGGLGGGGGDNGSKNEEKSAAMEDDFSLNVGSGPVPKLDISV